MGSFGGQRTADPQIVPGFEFLSQLSQLFGSAGASNIGSVFGAPGVPLPTDVLGRSQDALLAQLGLAPDFQAAYREGLQTGFAPDILAGIESRLTPALERSFARGAGSIREQASNLGTLNSTGTVGTIADFRGGLESGLLSNLASIESALGQGAQQVRGALAGGPSPGERAIASIIPYISEALAQSRFQANQPLAAIGAATGLADATPVFQPTYQPGKGASLFGALSPLTQTALSRVPLGGKGGSASKSPGPSSAPLKPAPGKG